MFVEGRLKVIGITGVLNNDNDSAVMQRWAAHHASNEAQLRNDLRSTVLDTLPGESRAYFDIPR